MHIVVLISLTSLLATKQISTVFVTLQDFFFKFCSRSFQIVFVIGYFFSWIAILKYNAYSFYMIIYVFFP